MTSEQVLRVETFRANTYLTALKSLARMFGGECGSIVIENIKSADEKISRYEKAVLTID